MSEEWDFLVLFFIHSLIFTLKFCLSSHIFSRPKSNLHTYYEELRDTDGFLLDLFFILKAEETRSLETPIGFQWTTLCCIPENTSLHSHCYVNFKSYSLIFLTLYNRFDWCAIVRHLHRICSSSQDSHHFQHPVLLHLPIIRFSWFITHIQIMEQSFSILLEIFISIFFPWIDI
jgi:hypothetical protein